MLLSTSRYRCFTRVLSQYLFHPKVKDEENKDDTVFFRTGCIFEEQKEKHALGIVDVYLKPVGKRQEL